MKDEMRTDTYISVIVVLTFSPILWSRYLHHGFIAHTQVQVRSLFYVPLLLMIVSLSQGLSCVQFVNCFSVRL